MHRNLSKQQAAQQQTTVQYEKTIQFSQAHAIVWQIKFILNQITSKKMMSSASNELENLSKQFGKEFDKYLLRELIEQIDLKDPVKAQMDRNDQFKVQLLNQELARCSLKHEFLQYFYEIVQHIFNDKPGEFLTELTKRLRLNFPTQLLIALSIFESTREDSPADLLLIEYQRPSFVALKLLKQKLADYYSYGKPELLPEYAVHRLVYLLSTNPQLDEELRDILQYIKDSNPLKNTSHISLRQALQQDIMFSNTSVDDPSISMIKDGNGLDNLDKAFKILEPWQILIDIGHYCTYNYSYLLKVLEDFKDVNEMKMARTLLHLAFNHTGTEDQQTRIVYSTFEACKKGDSTGLNKEPKDQKTQMTWSVDNLARAFRELYSNLNWQKVFEALTEVSNEVVLDFKAFQVFIQLFNKSKPQNVQYPLNIILNPNYLWIDPELHLSFIENTIQMYTEKKEKSINFQKLERRQELIEELSSIKEKVPIEQINVWLSIDLVEILIQLSDSSCFTKVRSLFDYPIKNLPEYLLLTLSHCKPKSGNLMIDELLSLLLPQFLGNHSNSIPVLQNLWKNNQALIIRGICELCRHDQRIMNLSRVLDITQEVKESLMPIVNCDDYYFAVNLGILAGKRDFLHYDQWLGERIKNIGTPFIKALLKYMKEHIIIPIAEYIKSRAVSGQAFDMNSDVFEQQKQQILDRSHLSKEKLCISMEHLSSLHNRQNPKIIRQTVEQINEFVRQISEYYPNQFQSNLNSEEIDNAANEYFQKVFSAEPAQVDQKIIELIDLMRRFKESEVKREQEIYACMLHSLFDEYRFLHRYPQQFLEKIAKLFGAIVRHRIIDGTLQDIALKFAFEAFRREGKRQKFGIITIRQFFDMLPQFPQFFDEIYENRHNIERTDPEMIRDIEQLYHRTRSNSQLSNASTNVNSAINSDTERSAHNEELKWQQEHPNQRRDEDSKQATQTKEDHKKQSQQQQLVQDKKDQTPGIQQMPTIDQEQFIEKFQQNQQRNTGSGQTNANTQQTQQQTSQNQNQTAAQQKQIQTANKNAQNITNSQTQITDNSVQRVANQHQDFVPSYKAKQQQTQMMQPTATKSQPVPENTNLNIQSAAFKRVTPNQANQNQQPPPQLTPQPGMMQSTTSNPLNQQLPQMNIINSQVFRPINMRSPTPTPQVNQQVILMQQQLDQKMQKAIQENAKIRLEDILEDTNMTVPAPDIQESIKFICNNTGKNNFNQKLEELKTSIAQNPVVNLNWFIQYILIRRITQSSNLYHLYIEMIKQLNPKDSIPTCIAQAVEIFKKCMLIDEEQLLRIVQRPSSQGSLVKQYLIYLGQFIGGLTVASNRPIYAKELDIKKLLVEAFQSDKLKYVISFVCRIFKETSKSTIFKPNNPWIKANLEILREIYDLSFQSNMDGSKNEIYLEIDSVCKSMGLNNINEVKESGFLRALMTRQYQSQSQQVEVSHLMNKSSLIPPPPAHIMQQQQQQQQLQQQQQQQQLAMRSQISPSPNFFQQPGSSLYPSRTQTPSNDSGLNQQQQEELSLRVTVSPQFMQHFRWLGQETEQTLRTLVAKAVDLSIIDILPPVVDRSVTIALITTRELVLKDFAYDSDFTRIQRAADLIVQNLAGSLALVTCREPLKMSLTTNLRKALQQLLTEHNYVDDELLNEALIQELAQTASKENLDLGCKLIKRSVVSKAFAKVREDPQIQKAVEKRKVAITNNVQFQIDDGVTVQFQGLPPQLQPLPNGLTESQFQVYEDFARLNSSQRRAYEQAQEAIKSAQVSQIQESSVSDIETIFRQLELQQSIDTVLKFQLTQKLTQLSTDAEVDESNKISAFAQKWLVSICEKFVQSNDIDQVGGPLEALNLIVTIYKGDDLQKKLTKQFLESNEDYPNNISLTILLMKNGILSMSEWDSHISQYLKDCIQFAQSPVFVNFIINFITKSIIQEQIFTYAQFPNIISVIEKISENLQFGQVFATIIDDLRSKFAWNKDTLKKYFHHWAIISFEENNSKQEQEVNKFFNNLSQIGLYKDADIMYNFCKVMVEVSIERALYTANGQKRPSDRLDYRYIESFLKLMVVLLRTADINKHEFMSKLFEAIQEVLDEDHKYKRAEFNQKPYYRLLINILIAVNYSQFVNKKTHLLILFSLADLFSKLNPNKYPAFSFAWLELISHKQFMPHFLSLNKQIQEYGNFVSSLSQNQLNRPGISGGQSQNLNGSQQLADNTFYQKWFKFKELIVNLFTFLKNNMIPGQPLSDPLVKFYEATLRVVLVIRHDFPEFLCDFYFNFVNSLPEHCIQLRNIILSANPKDITFHNPFSRYLKVDQIPEINQKPKMLYQSFENNQNGAAIYDNTDSSFNDHQIYLGLMNLREDLEKYFRTRNPMLIQVICDKMMQSEEIINGRRKINSNIINAVVLFIGNYAISKKSNEFREKECYELYKKIITELNNETRSCFLNCLINELRYINSQTYFYSWIVLYLFSDIDERIQEQITRILIERLQVHEPYPWGLCITFRELLQNPKYNFAKKSFVVQNMPMFELLFQTRLQQLLPYWQSRRVNDQQLDQQQQQQQLQQQMQGANLNQQ